MALEPLLFAEEIFPERGRFYAKCGSCDVWCEQGHNTKTGAERLAKALWWKALPEGWLCPSCANSGR